MVLPSPCQGNTRRARRKMCQTPLAGGFPAHYNRRLHQPDGEPAMLKKTLLAALFAAPVLGAWAETYLIDVRSPEEYAEAHADGAVNIPVEEVAAKIGAVTADKDADIYVYCRSGRRAGVAQETLTGLGYTKVTNLGTLADAQAFVARTQAEETAADGQAAQ